MTDPIEFEPHRARRYRKRSEILAFESKDAITYHKSWGEQDLPKGGWVAIALDAQGAPTGEVYGIDDDAFQTTYARSASGVPHRYMKTATVEAYPPGRPFTVRTELDDQTSPGTKKVEVERSAGTDTAMLVRNPGGEVYPVELEEFNRMYVEVKEPRRATHRDEHLDPDNGPKRILSIDGGGVRNVLSLGALEALEALLRKRYGEADLTLSDYFDLIAGTSTGGVIAAGLAAGKTVGEVIEWFRPVAPRVFSRRWTAPLLRPKHNPRPLREALDDLLPNERLGSETVRTGLLLVTKRLDTRGVWPLANNPSDPDWAADDEARSAGCAEYLLRELVCASAAAPYPMQPDVVEIFEGAGGVPPERGVFINGGISPHNNPALQALLIAARGDTGLGWRVGAERLLLVSVGAGWSPAQHQLRGMSIPDSVRSLHSMLSDAAQQIETMMQWLSESDTSRVIGPSLGSLKGELLAGEPLLSYARYDVHLDPDWLKAELDVDLSESKLAAMRPLDARDDAIDGLLDLGRELGRRRIKDDHLPDAFDLPPPASS